MKQRTKFRLGIALTLAAALASMALAQAAGARKVTPLVVSIAAHSPLMAHAQEEFNRAVAAALRRHPTTAGSCPGAPEGCRDGCGGDPDPVR